MLLYVYSCFVILWDLAIKKGSFIDNGDMKGLSLDQKAGKLVCPKVITGTQRVSKTSNVLGISKIALGPAQTTEIPVFANSCKSAEISKVFSANL